MIFGKKVANFDWEWGEIRPLEKGRKCPYLTGLKPFVDQNAVFNQGLR